MLLREMDMKRMQFVFAAAVIIGGIGFSVQLMAGQPAVNDVAVSGSTAVAAATLGGDDAAFVGSKKCKKCHSKAHKSWGKTKHGKALDLLKPGEAKEAKEKYKLDPAKDYTTDEACLKCHVVGHGKDGGYATPAADDKKAVRAAKSLAGVGCESCHGAGGSYMALHQEIFKAKRKYKVDEMYAAGVKKIEAATCTACHNDKSPTYDASAPFDFEKAKEAGIHEHTALELRE